MVQSAEILECMQEKLASEATVAVEVEGKSYDISKDMVTIEKKSKTFHGQNIIPSVIEPSFGIGRVLYCIFEHSFYARKDDAQKTVFKFTPTIAPIKVTVFPLLQQKELNNVAQEISLDLRRAGISSLMDTTGLHTLCHLTCCQNLHCQYWLVLVCMMNGSTF